jgi:hypothetical protein
LRGKSFMSQHIQSLGEGGELISFFFFVSFLRVSVEVAATPM